MLRFIYKFIIKPFKNLKKKLFYNKSHLQASNLCSVTWGKICLFVNGILKKILKFHKIKLFYEAMLGQKF